MIVRKLTVCAAIAAAMTLAACGSEAPPAETVAPPPLEQRVADLVAINAALQQYHTSHAAYPVSDRAQGFASNWGASLGARWIPELDLQPMPRDPAQSAAGDGPQYLYISDGIDYKLFAHATGDCGPDVQVQNVQIDPVRRNEERCWGYGFWSPGGAAF